MRQLWIGIPVLGILLAGAVGCGGDNRGKAIWPTANVSGGPKTGPMGTGGGGPALQGGKGKDKTAPKESEKKDTEKKDSGKKDSDKKASPGDTPPPPDKR
jgi:hypothetical protein